MNIVLWVVQILLAAVFLLAGGTKLLYAPERLVEMGMAYAGYVPSALVKLAAFAEVVGAVGLILPSLFRFSPEYTPRAAIGLATVMLLAAGTHLLNGEANLMFVPLILLVLCSFVAWGRGGKYAIKPAGLERRLV
ncbi:DoxX family protein [bacterium]|nr:DoxX family protein [bacterium]